MTNEIYLLVPRFIVELWKLSAILDLYFLSYINLRWTNFFTWAVVMGKLWWTSLWVTHQLCYCVSHHILQLPMHSDITYSNVKLINEYKTKVAKEMSCIFAISFTFLLNLTTGVISEWLCPHSYVIAWLWHKEKGCVCGFSVPSELQFPFLRQ